MEPFVVRYTVPLGGDGPAREINAPYVASFALQPLPNDPQVLNISYSTPRFCESTV